MHRRGRGRAGPSSSWESKTKRTNNLLPPNLKGKQIGLFFRDRQKQKKMSGPKEFLITFGIPESVENRIRINLNTIHKLAKSLNIPLKQTPNLFPDIKSKLEVEYNERPTNKTRPSTERFPESGPDEFNILWEPNSHNDESAANMSIEILDSSDEFKVPDAPSTSNSKAPDFIPIGKENPNDYNSGKVQLSLRGGGDYKYGYDDIITGTFEEKLDECLAKEISIHQKSNETKAISATLYEDYVKMQSKSQYRRMMEFRQKLPAYKKCEELLHVINNNQVIVISGETGCGKSTQVPQLILDNAIIHEEGANIHIVCTQPRRIAASSLAIRVAEERAERVGNSVGYAVRLEKVESRPRGSIMFVTTGVLLADLETNQGLTSYSHVILDEVHERDCHVDLSMCMLKKVLKKRKDLKLILMSATIDADKLSEYFDNCPMLHIEGLAYPVEDIYLEDILLMTGYQLPPERPDRQSHSGNRKHRMKMNHQMQKDIQLRAEIDGWLTEQLKVRPELRQCRNTLIDQRIENINVDLIIALMVSICRGPPGAILVFLPGIGDISKCIRMMNDSQKFPSSQYDIYPLHSKLASLDQHKIFQRPRPGVRKIIIATNIAETSITIDDIVYVIDCAKLKISGLNVAENVCTLQTEWISQANLRQRRGRAGRCQPGVCYHLLTSYRAGRLAERLLPELQRSDLLEPVLSVKRLRLGRAADAMRDVPSPPAPSTVQAAVQHLRQCGALNAAETLTPLGWHMARLPVHPAAGKLLLLGALFGCLDRAASVAAVWGFKDPFQLVIGKERETDEAKRYFALGEPSDHVAISEAIIQWESCSRNQRYQFAYRNFLSNNTLELLSDMKKQLGNSLHQMGFLPSGDVKAEWENRNRNNLSLFKAIVAASLYPKTASVRWINANNGRKPARIKATLPEFGPNGNRQTINVHPSSVMSTANNPRALDSCTNRGANWLVYWLMQRSTDLFLIEATLVYTLPLLFFGELTVKVFDGIESDMCLMAVSSVNVKCKRSTAGTLFELRALLDQVLASRVTAARAPAHAHTALADFQECVLKAVIELITAEDERAEYLDGDGDDESDASEREYY